MRFSVLGWLFCCSATVCAAPLVVETEPNTPEQQRAMFHLPPGFEIQLIASDPDIGQPMNLAFDAAGRLWVTHSVEYPYPVDGPGVQPREERFAGLGMPPARDRLSVISGIGPDGKPKSIVHFATGLNIPIGLTPLSLAPSSTFDAQRSTTAIAFTIPNITRFTDTDGDGVSDEQQPLYGPFGNLDTHGMTNSFTRWLDGWIYACHGFRNTSTLQGTDGDAVTLNSGNTFRFRADGSRIEQWTWGQVNPFGLTFDRWGNAYNADCHSMPLTCLLPGAYYPSFGKPHDGLGFAPNMIDHSHGSTGICGVAWYEATHFPEEYRDCIFLCNPVNGQVHRDRIVFRGSSPWVETQPEFVTCDDGWFRPVDIKLGPDGALYIADFYNAVIGHYEVPLQHPRRDRTRGRIWRIVWRGTDETPVDPPELFDLTRLTIDQLVERLGDANITIRTAATHQLVDHPERASVVSAVRSTFERILKEMEATSGEFTLAHGMWVLARCGALPSEKIPQLMQRSALVRAHLAHLAGDPQLAAQCGQPVLPQLLRDQDPIVQRAAAMSARLPSNETLSPVTEQLLKLEHTADAGDSHLRHALRIAARNHLSAGLVGTAWDTALETDPKLLSDIAMGARDQHGARLAQRLLQRHEHLPHSLSLLQHQVRYVESGELPALIDSRRTQQANDLDRQLQELESIYRGLSERGLSTKPLHEWGTQLARRLLDMRPAEELSWTEATLDGQVPSQPTFVAQQRAAADGDTASAYFSSLPNGEQRTGLLRSDPFPIPAELSFYVAGHNGFPGGKLHGTNRIRLRNTETGDVLAECGPPRNDTAQQVTWTLADHAGQFGTVEIVDGDAAKTYAWLAVGRFSIPSLNPGSRSSVQQAAHVISFLQLESLSSDLMRLLQDEQESLASRLDAANALALLHPDSQRRVLLVTARETPLTELKEQCLHALSSESPEAVGEQLSRVMQTVSGARQSQFAQILLGDADGGEALLALVASGKASALLLTRADIVDQLRALRLPDLNTRLASLTRDLPPANEQLAQVLQQRKVAVDGLTNPDPAEGAAIFKRHCAACHQVRGEGNKIGPQLDGIGQRGLDRLLEDILDPHRNVDAAFRTTTLAMLNGQVLTGLKRRDAGATLVFANPQGQEFTVQAADIEEQRTTPLSLMPANLGEQIPEQDFAQLVKYLLAAPKP